MLTKVKWLKTTAILLFILSIKMLQTGYFYLEIPQNPDLFEPTL